MINKRSTRAGTRYDVRLRDPEGRETSRTFRTLAEAKAYERKTLTERDRGAWLDPRRGIIPFAEVADAWLKSNPAKRPSVRVRDAAMLRLHVLPTIGRAPHRLDHARRHSVVGDSLDRESRPGHRAAPIRNRSSDLRVGDRRRLHQPLSVP